MPDQEVHEIQLNGKQLVFMFMAATVVSVVIFLCGVMVGRGVRPPQADLLAAGTEVAVDPTAPIEANNPTSALSTDRVPVTTQETLTYAERLEARGTPVETLKPAPVAKPEVAKPETKTEAKPAVINKPEAKPEAKAEAKPAVVNPEAKPVEAKLPVVPAVASRELAVKALAAKETAQSATFVEPPGKGFVVQVMATVTRSEAETLARRLNGKGYPTFISLAGAAAPARYRVRVGKYNSKSDAQAVFRRLEQEEHFKPWLSR